MGQKYISERAESPQCSTKQTLRSKDQANINYKIISCIIDLNKVKESNINMPNLKEQGTQTSQNDVSKKKKTHYPFFIYLICVVQVILYLRTDYALTSLYCYSPKYRSQLWRPLTYSFFHANLCHLCLNIGNLMIFGSTFEVEHGLLKAIVIYVTGAIAGALGFDFFDGTQRMIGASGACSAFLMAHLSYLVLNWKAIKYWKYRKAVVISFAMSDIISGPLSRILKLEQKFSWISHMSAGLNGFIVGLLILDSKNKKVLVKLRWFIVVLYVMITELLIVQYVPTLMDSLYRHSKRYNY